MEIAQNGGKEYTWPTLTNLLRIHQGLVVVVVLVNIAVLIFSIVNIMC